jgi:hypothetical protein
LKINFYEFVCENMFAETESCLENVLNKDRKEIF